VSALGVKLGVTRHCYCNQLCQQQSRRNDDGWFGYCSTPTDTEALYIILTPANQLMLMGLKVQSLSKPGWNQRPFDHWPTSLPTALTGPTKRNDEPLLGEMREGMRDDNLGV
jgi:hypothetical protein